MWVAGLSAAAVIAGLFALVVLPGGGPSPESDTSAIHGASAAQGLSAPIRGLDSVFLQPKTNFTSERVQAFARDLAAGRDMFASLGGSSGSAAPAPTAGSPTPGVKASGNATAAPPSASAATGLKPAGPQVSACIQQEVQIKPADRVAQVVQAKYNGTPAYIVALREQTGSGTTKVVVWVVNTQSCSILSYTQATG